MYRSFYRLSERPFEISTDTRFLWMGEKHKEALAMLKYGVLARKGFLLLTGDVGTGKTTLVNALLESLSEDTLVANITDPLLEPVEFFNFIAASFHIPERFDNKADFLLRFGDFLRESNENGKNVLLILDEAHRLSKDLLEQFRLLSNIELPEKKLINIFFVGQNEFNRTLMSAECRALRQRITLTHNIKPLSEAETLAYVGYRLKVAGTETEIFNRKAVAEIHRFSQGYPRLINILCDHALLTGFVRQTRKITPTIIEECSQELCLLGDTIRTSSSDFFHRPVETEASPRQEGVARDPVEAGEKTNGAGHAGVPAAEPQARKAREEGPMPKREKGPAQEPVRPAAEPRHRKLSYWVLAVSVLVALAAAALLLQEDSFSNAPETAPPDASRPIDPPPEPETVTLAPSEPYVQATSSGRVTVQERTPLEGAREALAKGNLDQAAALLEDAIPKNPVDLPDLQVLYAVTLRRQAGMLSRENPEKAERLLTRAVEADPKSPEAFAELGMAYTKSRKYAEAIRAYRKAVDLDDRSADTFFNLGFLYASTEDYEGAERMFLRAVELRPSFLDKALFNLGAVQCRQGKIQSCIDSLEEALAENPGNERARTYLSRVKAYQGGAR